MTALRFENLSIGPAKQNVLSGLTASFDTGLIGVVGPNGVGKTTLLRAAMGLLKPSVGTVWVRGTPLSTLDLRARAQAIAYLPQNGPVHWAMRVRDLVELGRFACEKSKAENAAAIQQALTECAIEDLSERTVNTLSGGERSRVLLARALCAQTPIILVDEPTNALDPAQQHRIMGILLARAQAGTTVLCAIHDLPLAARYCDRLVFLNNGKIEEDGTPAQVLTADRFHAAYGLRFDKRGYLADDQPVA